MRLLRGSRLLRSWSYSISAVLLALATGLVFLNIVFRDLFTAPIPWAEELSVLLLIMMIFVSQVFLEIENEQLAITFLSAKWRGPLGRRILRTANGLIVIVVYGALTRAGLAIVITNYRLKSTTPVLQLPLFMIFSVVTAVAFLIVVNWVIELVFRNGEVRL